MIIKEIEDFVKQNLEPEVVEHVFRVRDYAVRIALKEGANKEIVEIAALLHDIGYIKSFKSHDRWGAPIARHFLGKRGYDLVKVGKVVNCILRHAKEKPETIEQKVIWDADCLDRLGALGVLRISVNQIKYGVSKPIEIPSFIRKVLQDANHLHTMTAKIIAKPLIEFDKQFIKLLNWQLKALKEE